MHGEMHYNFKLTTERSRDDGHVRHLTPVHIPAAAWVFITNECAICVLLMRYLLQMPRDAEVIT